jgi:hypothetical protein
VCEYTAGELLVAVHRDDPAGADVIRRLLENTVSHVRVIERLEDRLAKVGLHPRKGGAFEFYRLAVPPGQEVFKVGIIHFIYKHAVLDAFAAGRLDPANPLHMRILGDSRLGLQVAPNAVLSVNASASPAPGTQFTFNATHGAYKTLFGWPGGGPGTGAGVKVLVMDTGVDSLSAYNVTDGRNFLDDTRPQDVTDDHGHGTVMASIVHDVAPDTEVVVYKVADKDGLASEWTLLAGLKADSGAAVANLSLSFGLGDLDCPTCGRASHTTRSALFESMISDLMGSPDPPFLVAAAGNEGQGELSFPARYGDVLAIASVDGALALSQFSNCSTTDHEGGPHANVFLLPGGQGGPGSVATEYVGASGTSALAAGTSVASAYACGTIARLWSDPARTGWSRNRMLTHLIANASQAVPGFNAGTHGNGLLRCV